MARPNKNNFPGLKRCLAMLRSRNAMTQEEGYFMLLPHVDEHLDALIATLQAEKNPYMQSWLLELIGDASNPATFSILVEYFFAPNVSVRQWARFGLANLRKTSEGRRILWKAHFQGVQMSASVAHTDADVRALQHYLAQLLRDERIED